MAVSHPDPQELGAFLQGRLSEEGSALIEAHLLTCDACTLSLEGQPQDALLRLARRLGCPGDSSLPPLGAATLAAAPDSTVSHAPPGAGSGDPGGDVPALLAGNPRYRVLRLLGQGGMGAVYLAEHRVMQRLVALKVIKQVYTADPAAVERFQREARAAAQLQHPNIVTAHDADQAGETHFLIMEHVEGVSLARLVKEKGPLPVVQACDDARQAALGLQHAHARGLVHRDVKPDNLMLTADGTVKVLDFGLAALTAERRADGVTLTSANVLMGTPDYMAPEQAEDARAADTRADVYSLGCTLFHLLTGRIPYPATTGLAKVLAHREKPVPSARELRPEVPPELDAVVARMLAKSPADRYQTPGEAAEALAPFATGQGQDRAAHARPRGWRRVGIGVAAAVLCGLLGLAGHLFGPALVGDSRNDVGPARVQASAPPVKAVSWEGEGPRALFADRAHALEGVLDFQDLAGASAAELRAWYEALGPDFRLALVTSRRGNGPPLFNAVAVREKTPRLFRFRRDVPWDNNVQFRATCGDGVRLLSLGYPPPDRADPWLETQVWVKDGLGFHVQGGSLQWLMGFLDKKKAEGMRPYDLVWSVDPRDGPYYAAALASVQDRGWEAFYSLSPDELLATVQAYRGRGWRPDVVSPHWQDGRLRFLLIVVDNRDRVDWRFRVEMTLRQYQQESAEQEARGLFPLALASYGDGPEVRCTAVWVRYRAPGAPRAAPGRPVPAERARKAVTWASVARPKNRYADLARALTEVLDWREITGATLKEVQDWANGLGPDFRVSDFSARRGAGPALFNAVAVRDRNRVEFRFLPDLDTPAAEASWKSRLEEGFRPYLVCLHRHPGQTPNEWNHAQLWVKDGCEWYCWLGTPDHVRDSAAAVRPDFRVTYLDAVSTPDGPGLRTFLAPSQGRKWEAEYTLTAEELLSAVEFSQRRGWRPDVVAPSPDGPHLRFLLVTVENSDQVDWRFRMDMTLAQYRAESTAQKQRGLFPLTVSSYGDEANVRYAAVWVRAR
jgi:predicted Ser/Thr protein kinase